MWLILYAETSIITCKVQRSPSRLRYFHVEPILKDKACGKITCSTSPYPIQILILAHGTPSFRQSTWEHQTYFRIEMRGVFLKEFIKPFELKLQQKISI